MNRRVYVEKKEAFAVEARLLGLELAKLFGQKYPELAGLKTLRIVRRYDAEGLDETQFKQLSEAAFYDPQSDLVFCEPVELSLEKNQRFFGVEYNPGQYDLRSDSAEQCAELIIGVKPRVKCADFYIFESSETPFSDACLEEIKKYIINPVDAREITFELPFSPIENTNNPPDVPELTGFIHSDKTALKNLAVFHGIAMSIEDLLFCREYFAREGRDPTLTELKVLDTYWSDHCRHTTFNTALEEIKLNNASDENTLALKKALQLYEETRREIYGAEAEKRKRTLMDMATIGTRALKKKGLVPDLDESAEVNACTIKIKAEFSNADPEPWLLLFKNETHNHPTEIEPYGGAATCLGGAIRDPLSGRAFVYQAMRVTGGGDPRAGLDETLPGKLPQIKIAREAAAGYAAYGNELGLASGHLAEFYHPGFLAKRMELGAVIGAVPEAWVRREEPLPGDLVILVGGKTGRDGIGGATSSSKVHSGETAESASAEVQKGNPIEERKLVRLFRKAEACRLIKRCNDFGAGGVSVALGEIAAGLDIDLDAVPVKYPGLDGTELAISESQERMAVVTSAADAETFIKAAAAENLEATVIAKITCGNQSANDARLRMNWRGKTIVNLSRKFLNTNGAPRAAAALLKSGQAPALKDDLPKQNPQALLENLERELSSLRSGSRRGLQERFDSSAGAASVLFPWGGSEQGTPECGMAALLPAALSPALNEQSCTSIKLVRPANEHKDQIERYKTDIMDSEAFYGTGGLEKCSSIDEWIKQCDDYNNGKGLADGDVPTTTFIAVRESDNKIVGSVQIRHRLTGPWINIGGYIAYMTAVSERRKGYSKEILKLCLPECEKIGIDKVFVACKKQNIYSAKAILASGGILEKETVYEGEILQRYLINLSASSVRPSRTASLMTFGYDPVVMSVDPYSGAKGSIREALAKFACLGGDPFKARLSLQEYFERPENPETWGKPAAALLGALEAQLRLGVPAIGGKDSMSGNYRDEGRGIKLSVPPTLVAFAAGTVAADQVRSGVLQGATNDGKEETAIILLSQPAGDEWERFKANMKALENLAASGVLKAAYPVGPGGVAATLAVMAFGNMVGVQANSDSFTQVNSLNYQGSVLAEIDEDALGSVLSALVLEPAEKGKPRFVIAGKTLKKPVFRIDNAEIQLEQLRRAYESALAGIYPQTSTGATVAESAAGKEPLEIPPFNPATTRIDTQKHLRLSKQGAPLVVLPVFPGTNSEWDMEKAFLEGGGRTKLVVFKNRNREDIEHSLKELAAAFGQAQIIALSGGFCDGPKGSGGFIANILRMPIIAGSITEFLEKRGGLVIGICNGFQGLLKSGLVPYGRITTPKEGMPAFAANAIGRNVSRMIRTRVMPNISPWLSLEETGSLHLVPISHGEGRIVMQSEEAKALFAAGQVPFCYADAAGYPTMAEPDNPNGTAFAIESLTSPDGRVLGKMGHSERCGEFVHINIPGNKKQRIFEAGIKYWI